MAVFIATVDTSQFECPTCQGKNFSVIRADKSNPRLKCGQCQFTFNGQDALHIKEKGLIPSSSSEALAEATEPESIQLTQAYPNNTLHSDSGNTSHIKYPSTGNPAYVLVSSDRRTVEFVSRRELKKAAVRWHNNAFSVYELKSVKLNVKVDISSKGGKV